MGDLSGYRFWINNPDFRLFKAEEESAEDSPLPPRWCSVSRPLVEWGDTLLSKLSYNPTPHSVGFGMWKLLVKYHRLYRTSSADHRAETNLDNHLCSHQALLAICEKLEDLELATGIPELEPPQQSETHPTIIDAEPEPTGTEYNGIVIGHRMR